LEHGRACWQPVVGVQILAHANNTLHEILASRAVGSDDFFAKEAWQSTAQQQALGRSRNWVTGQLTGQHLQIGVPWTPLTICCNLSTSGAS